MSPSRGGWARTADAASRLGTRRDAASWHLNNSEGNKVKSRSIGILHPGEMGVSIAASAQNSGCEVYWVSEGRREPTRERAARFGLRDARTLAELCHRCAMIISVCPPHAAESQANDVVAAGFTGSYVDSNA